MNGQGPRRFVCPMCGRTHVDDLITTMGSPVAACDRCWVAFLSASFVLHRKLTPRWAGVL